jgi:uncharacterized protein
MILTLKNKWKTRLNHVSLEWIKDFCQRWNIQEFALFGSVLRDDFNYFSDLDILLEFKPESNLDLFDLVRMKRELEEKFERSVDIIEKKMLENPYRQAEIFKTYQVIYSLQKSDF